MEKLIRTVAMYLPQFHETEENNAWWGKGFTDWTAAANAKPLFPEHIQPRTPLDGPYDLLDRAVMEKQCTLAEEYGIDGFCFYHYDFGNGRRMLEKPAENLLAWKDIPLSFCFCWANESWTRTWRIRPGENGWDGAAGSGGEVLIAQNYGDEAEWRKHFAYLLPFFLDPRYIRIGGCPVFVIYRPERIPDLPAMTAVWRELAAENGLAGLYLIGANLSGPSDCLDAAMRCAPVTGIPFGEETLTDPRRYDASDVWSRILEAPPVGGMKTFYEGYAGYDDTPRRGKEGIVLTGNSPEVFRRYLPQIMRKNLIEGNPILFLNAWNEWGEGNMLEPDGLYGYGFLQAVRETYDSGDYLTEKEYALRDFQERFAPFAGRKILLFGTGANAQALVERFDGDFHFAGLIDDQKAGGFLYGKQIAALEDALASSPDAVILAAQPAAVHAIVQRDGDRLFASDTRVFDLYGNDLGQLYEDVGSRIVITKEIYMEEILNHDVLSVDVMDTLLKRDLFRPGKVFFSEEMLSICRFAADHGRKVFYITDPSEDTATQMDALREAGLLRGSGEVIDEQAYGRNKLNGLYRILRNRAKGTVLHIGNDLLADVIAPRMYGLHSLGCGYGWSGQLALRKADCMPERNDVCEEDLMRAIDSHDLILFDVFDTLVRRACIFPEDIFRILAFAMRERYPAFEELRKSAQIRAENGDIFRIYEVMAETAGMSAAEAEKILRAELALEKILIRPNAPAIRLLRYAKKQGKTVKLVSDMYLPGKILTGILRGIGISDYDELIVSCDHGKRKREGLFAKAAEEGRKTLMIGDSLQEDAAPARECGFDTFVLPDGNLRSSMRETEEAETAEEISRVLTGYMLWLVSEGMAEKTDGMIFQARDGYLFRQLYEHVRKDFPSLLPPSFYLPISRTSAIALAADLTDPALSSAQAKKEAPRQRQYFYRILGDLGLTMGGSYELFDFYSGGTVQSCLSRFVPFTLTGLYYGINNRNILGDAVIHSCLRGRDGAFFDRYQEMEQWITAPSAGIASFSEGGPVCASDERSREERRRLCRVQKAALSASEAMLDEITFLFAGLHFR